MPLLIGLHALKDEVIARMPLRIIGDGWALDGGGNARGLGALDLQTRRNNVTQVASGDYSVVIGGADNTANKTDSMVIGGAGNTASGDYGSFVIGGMNNTASGYRAIVIGGDNNQASGNYSIVLGGYTLNIASGKGAIAIGGQNNTASGYYSMTINCINAVADKFGQKVESSFIFNAAGDAQPSRLCAGCKTTNNTPEELFLDGDGGSARCTIASDTTWSFHILVVARRTDADNESAAYDFIGCIDNNAGTTALVGSVIKTVVAEDTAGWDCNVTADNTNDALIITATGENAKTIQWVAFIQLVETTG